MGVKTPTRRPPITTTGSTRAGRAFHSACRTSARLLRSSVWKAPPRDTKRHASTSETAMRMPGTMAAMKSPLIETLAMAPKTTSAMDGGITGAMTPPAASRPPDEPSG